MTGNLYLTLFAPLFWWGIASFATCNILTDYQLVIIECHSFSMIRAQTWAKKREQKLFCTHLSWESSLRRRGTVPQHRRVKGWSQVWTLHSVDMRCQWHGQVPSWAGGENSGWKSLGWQEPFGHLGGLPFSWSHYHYAKPMISWFQDDSHLRQAITRAALIHWSIDPKMRDLRNPWESPQNESTYRYINQSMSHSIIAHPCVCVHIDMCVYIYIYVYIYVYIYIHMQRERERERERERDTEIDGTIPRKFRRFS